MNPITLPTSPETRAALEKVGLLLMKERPGFEEWRTKDEASAIGLFHGTAPAIHGDWGVLAPALAILGIGAPPGYVLMPVGVASSGWSLVEGVALQWAIRARGGVANDVSMAATWKAFGDALYAAISSPHQTPIQDQAAAIQADSRPVFPGGEGSPDHKPRPAPPLPPPDPPQPQPSVDGGLSPSPPGELSACRDCKHWEGSPPYIGWCPITATWSAGGDVCGEFAPKPEPAEPREEELP